MTCAAYLKAAYFNGTQWMDLKSDSAVPADARVVEITADQRGIVRNARPCIGAFEFTSADRAESRFQFPPMNSVIHYRLMNSTLLVGGITPRDRVRLYSLSGRHLMNTAGNSRIDLSLLAPQPLFVQVEREGCIVSTGRIMAPGPRIQNAITTGLVRN
jgi:hypothetical protein